MTMPWRKEWPGPPSFTAPELRLSLTSKVDVPAHGVDRDSARIRPAPSNQPAH
jgi:hypothetical protein